MSTFRVDGHSVANGARDNGANLRTPGYLSYLGGAVVTTAQSHAVYVNPSTACPASTCWGDPEGFLGNLGQTEFIHLADQYVGLRNSYRYTVGANASVTYPTTPGSPLTDNA